MAMQLEAFPAHTILYKLLLNCANYRALDVLHSAEDRDPAAEPGNETLAKCICRWGASVSPPRIVYPTLKRWNTSRLETVVTTMYV